MSTYTLPELLQKWARSELSLEQAIGYLLQHVFAFGQRLVEIEQRLRQLEQPRPEAGDQGARKPQA
jgi:hypothetical protein